MVKIKQVNTSKAAKCKKSKEPSQPTLESILAKADKAFTGVVIRYFELGQALVEAITYYGSEGRKAFRCRFPLTENTLKHLELVGRMRLLPHFALCSDRFVNGLVEMKDSTTWQYKLIGASSNGKIRVKVDGDIVDKSFTDFVKEKDVNCLLTILSDENKDLTLDELADKICNMYDEVRSKFVSKPRYPFEIKYTAGGKKVVRFYQVKSYTVDDLRAIIAKMEAEDTQEA